jgi:hypothetical protein
MSSIKSIAPKAPRELIDILMCVNRCSFAELGYRNSCILTSHALDYVLRQLGYTSKVLRISATVYPIDQRLTGVALGLDSYGNGRRPKAGKDHWHGHVAVLVNNRWLLDPTLDQANRDSINVTPVAFEMTTLEPRGPLIFLRINDCDVRYEIYRNQKRFATAPDARPSHWMSVAMAALAELEQNKVPDAQGRTITPNPTDVPAVLKRIRAVVSELRSRPLPNPYERN